MTGFDCGKYISYHLIYNGSAHCVHLKLGGSYRVMKNQGIQFI